MTHAQGKHVTRGKILRAYLLIDTLCLVCGHERDRRRRGQCRLSAASMSENHPISQSINQSITGQSESSSRGAGNTPLVSSSRATAGFRHLFSISSSFRSSVSLDRHASPSSLASLQRGEKCHPRQRQHAECARCPKCARKKRERMGKL